MKMFWAIVLILLLACAAYLAFGRGGSVKPLVNAKPAPEIAPPMNYGVPLDESAFFDSDAASRPTTPAKAAPEQVPPVITPVVPIESDRPANPAPAPSTPADPPAPTPPVDASKPTGAAPVPANVVPKESAPKDVPPVKPVVTPPAVNPAVTPPAGSAGANPSAPDAANSTTAPKTESTEFTMVKQDDGSMLIDNKYTVRGEGTKESPYQITWEYLTSAEEVYQPRLGKKKLPGRLTMLNDHYVKISGYIAFPIMATEPTEMLTMLNQWDGCCIGVPPSPYDAIEVKLKKAAEGEERLASYGAVSGKMKVEPYLVKDWLVSLYLMDEGEITKK